MANIMIIDSCNLHCPYCFADEFVNKECNPISEENFRRAIDFIVSSKSHRVVGLIGGEPTLHPRFNEFLGTLIDDNRVQKVVIYTNGVYIDEHINLVSNPKVGMLINCNSPEDIGQQAYNRLLYNLDRLFIERKLKNTITLGVNLYESRTDYSYIEPILKRYNLDHIRISITVPNIENKGSDSIQYFIKMKPMVIQLISNLLKNGVVPNFDCNKLPACLMDDKDIEILNADYPPQVKEKVFNSNINSKRVECNPVIDIRQDLTAVRCFGLSEYTKQSISDFESIDELIDYYINEIDTYAYGTISSEECIDCWKRKTRMCMGGCLAYKIEDIRKVREYSGIIMQEKKD